MPAARLHGYPRPATRSSYAASAIGCIYHVREAAVIGDVVGVARRDEVYDELRRIGRASLESDD